MGAKRTMYQIVGCYQRGREVIGYHLQCQDGTSGPYTREQVFYLTGRGQITNCSAQVYFDRSKDWTDGKVLLRGVGGSLDSLPVKKLDANGSEATAPVQASPAPRQASQAPRQAPPAPRQAPVDPAEQDAFIELFKKTMRLEAGGLPDGFVAENQWRFRCFQDNDIPGALCGLRFTSQPANKLPISLYITLLGGSHLGLWKLRLHIVSWDKNRENGKTILTKNVTLSSKGCKYKHWDTVFAGGDAIAALIDCGVEVKRITITPDYIPR